MTIHIYIKKLKKRKEKILYYTKNESIQLKKIHEHDSGFDLQSNLNKNQTIYPGEIKLIPTGISIKLPENIEGQIRSRSGLALNGIIVLNSPGTIDRGYTGEIKVILINLSKEKYEIKYLDKIAQLVFSEIVINKIKMTNNIGQITSSPEKQQGINKVSGLLLDDPKKKMNKIKIIFILKY